jgi:serine phosphatase RsbU (regulator of sigma subunit)
MKVLLVEDNAADLRMVREMVFESGSKDLELVTAQRLHEAIGRLRVESFDAVLLDLGLPDAQGVEALEKVQHTAPDIPIVVLSGLPDETVAVEAVRSGAQDYLLKERSDAVTLTRAIRYATERKRAELKMRHLAHHDSLTDLHERMQAERTLAERLTVANVRLDREAQRVARLQADMLPNAPPHLLGYQWSIRYEPCTRAGGDYYDFVTLTGGRVGILIADASGHGASAAVLMAMARSALFMVARSVGTPGLVLAEMNRHLAQLIPAGSFVTAAYVILNPRTGNFDYALAGHDPPLVMRGVTGGLETLALSGGPVLGPFPDMPFPAASDRLKPGDALILYTDGLPEALDPNGEMLGEEPFRATLESARNLGPDAMRDRVLDRVVLHRAGSPVMDDLTLVILSRDA